MEFRERAPLLKLHKSPGGGDIASEINWFVEEGLKGVPVPEGNCQWLIEIEGKPSGRITFDLLPTLTGEGSYDPIFYATMSTTIGAIPGVVAAEPGILQGPVFAPYAPRLDLRQPV